jgi:hypothetical protein
MKKRITKNTLENNLNAVESAVRDSFPVNSSVVSNLHEIVRLAMKGYELEKAAKADAASDAQPEHNSFHQLGIR